MHRILLRLAALAPACPAQAADVSVRATREGDTLRVEASAGIEPAAASGHARRSGVHAAGAAAPAADDRGHFDDPGLIEQYFEMRDP